MVFRDLIRVEALAVIHLRKAKAVLIVLCERHVAAVNVVEDTEFHAILLN